MLTSIRMTLRYYMVQRPRIRAHWRSMCAEFDRLTADIDIDAEPVMTDEEMLAMLPGGAA